MIEAKYSDLIAASTALAELAQQRLPVVGALRVQKVIKAVQGHLDDAEVVRKQLLDRHARKDKHGELACDDQGNATFDDDGMERFRSDYVELMGQQVEIEHGIRVSDLGSIEIAPATLLALGALLEEGE